MKAKETKKRGIKIILLLAMAVFAFVPLHAQKLIKKELETANEEADGFQYQWYKYSYVLGKDTLDAAFDLNGKRITPNGYKRGKDSGVYYAGGGMFGVLVNKFGEKIRELYNNKGICVIPESKGFTNFWAERNAIILCYNYGIKPFKCAAYDSNGNSIISEALGYNWIGYYEEYGCFWCQKLDSDLHSIENSEVSISPDGKYYAVGKCNREEFLRKKKPFNNSSNYASNTSSSGNSSSYSSSTTSSSNGESNLLYEGEYTIQNSQAQDLINGYSIGSYSSDDTERVKIYEDHMTINNGTNCKYKSTNSSGERVYEGSGSIGGTVTAYVSPSYNIRLVNESWFNGMHMKVGIPVVKGRSLMPEYSGGNNSGTSSGYQPTNNNSGSTGTSSGSKHGSYVKEETCPACHGTKTCETCLGRGWRNNPFTNQHDTCPICRGRKTCQTCNGSGKVSKTVYY